MDKIIIGRGFVCCTSIVFWLACRLIYILIRKINKRHLDISREVYINLMAIYIIILIAGVFFPIVLQFGDNIIRKGPKISLRPIAGLIAVYKHSGAKAVLTDIIVNVVLLTPLILFLRILWYEKVNSLYKVMLIAFLVSVSIEGLQAVESILIAGTVRTTDINDVLLNTISGAGGFMIYGFIKNLGLRFTHEEP